VSDNEAFFKLEHKMWKLSLYYSIFLNEKYFTISDKKKKTTTTTKKTLPFSFLRENSVFT